MSYINLKRLETGFDIIKERKLYSFSEISTKFNNRTTEKKTQCPGHRGYNEAEDASRSRTQHASEMRDFEFNESLRDARIFSLISHYHYYG